MKKRGRRPTGLKRPHIVQIGTTAEENEFIARISYYNGFSTAVYGRTRLLTKGWRQELEHLREVQNNLTLDMLDGRRKNK